MTAAIHLIHGIHTQEGDTTVAWLRPYLATETQLPVVYHQYGYTTALLTRALNRRRARKIAQLVADTDGFAVGHSNGCALIWRMLNERMTRFRGVVFINPALEKDIDIPPTLEFVHVYHNRYDGAVPLTETPIIRRIFLDPYWGTMGADGYTGKDKRVTNFDCWDSPADQSLPPVSGHSAIFEPQSLHRGWGKFIAATLKSAIK